MAVLGSETLRDRMIRSVGTLRDSLWFRPALYALLAVGAVAICSLIEWIDIPLDTRVDRDLVSTLLNIITTSMLTVTTFAVGSMVSAYASATNSGTPRAFQLIIADGRSQNAASSFIGAFIFGVVATIGLEAGLYRNDGAGLFALAVLTVGILVWVIGTFIVWFDNIARLGQVGTSIQKAEAAASNALDDATISPYLGGTELTADGAADTYVEVFPEKFGYLSTIEMFRLEAIADEIEASISVRARPGALIDPSVPIATIDGLDRADLGRIMRERADEIDLDDFEVGADTEHLTGAVVRADGTSSPDGDEGPTADERVEAAIDEFLAQVQAAFVVADHRSFSADPEFSLTVLGEIAAKALSPGVNDPGTALSVINSLTRQISDWHGRSYDIDEPDFPRVRVPAIETHRLVRAGFDTIVRYGSGDADVVQHLMASFRYLSNTADEHDDGKIRGYAIDVLERAHDRLTEREYAEIAGLCPTDWTGQVDADLSERRADDG